IALQPLTLFPVSGRVVDASSGAGIVGAQVELFGRQAFATSTTSGPGGAFTLSAPNGTNYMTVGGLDAYNGTSVSVPVAGPNTPFVTVSLAPLALGEAPSGREADILLPLLALGTAAAVAGAWMVRRRRVAQGLPPAILSSFGRFVAMRALLIPVQSLFLLTVLYLVGTVLVGVSHGAAPSSYWDGYWVFLRRIFGLDWGEASFGNLRQPATQLIAWWFGDSLELALLAIPLSILIAYPLGLLAGWRREGAFDYSARTLSLAGLIFPSFLVMLVILTSLYDPFRHFFGDDTYGTLPSIFWFQAHGGTPHWIGIAGNTEPTTLPLVDGLLHQDMPFVTLVLAKALLQAAAIAVVYVSVFLRYARHAIAESAREGHVVAARARGVPERTILWRHLGVRIWPVYLLVLGITLPVYVGTQALVEALSNDTGLGALLLSEVTRIYATGFGFGSAPSSGNFYQVAIFLLLLTVLIANLASDVLARYLDPRLLREER
ncbi:MAG TPA: ABC transporter permease subunit, partial [Thermoplasmata archaeon]|nr:ABC transporter permease subunit [Thermoplasmata archaeon]